MNDGLPRRVTTIRPFCFSSTTVLKKKNSRKKRVNANHLCVSFPGMFITYFVNRIQYVCNVCGENTAKKTNNQQLRFPSHFVAISCVRFVLFLSVIGFRKSVSPTENDCFFLKDAMIYCASLYFHLSLNPRPLCTVHYVFFLILIVFHLNVKHW